MSTTPAITTRDQILDTAYALFMDQGYERTPIQAIIEAVGIAKGTFYHPFRSKDDLLDDVVDRLMVATVAIIDGVISDPELRAIEKFKGLFSSVGMWKLEHRTLMLELGARMREAAAEDTFFFFSKTDNS